MGSPLLAERLDISEKACSLVIVRLPRMQVRAAAATAAAALKHHQDQAAALVREDPEGESLAVGNVRPLTHFRSSSPSSSSNHIGNFWLSGVVKSVSSLTRSARI